MKAFRTQISRTQAIAPALALALMLLVGLTSTTAATSLGPGNFGPRTSELATRRSDNAGSMTYQSPTTGFRLVYDDSWSIVEENNWDDSDGIMLTNGKSTTVIIGELGPPGVFDFCLSAWERKLLDAEGVTNAAPMIDQNGNAVRGEARGRRWEAFTLTRPSLTGKPVDLGLYLECRISPSGDVLLSIWHEAPLADYDDESIARDDLLAGLEF